MTAVEQAWQEYEQAREAWRVAIVEGNRDQKRQLMVRALARVLEAEYREGCSDEQN